MTDDTPALEKRMASGESMTLAPANSIGWWDVDQWDANDNNRWHRQYNDYAQAKAEYDRWN